MNTLSDLIACHDDINQLNSPSLQVSAGGSRGTSLQSARMAQENSASESMPHFKQLLHSVEASSLSGQSANRSANQCIEELLSRGPLPETPLGHAVEGLTESWDRLLMQMNAHPGFTNPSLEHIKETAECAIRDLKDSCDDVCGEFTRVSLSWRVYRPDEAASEDVEDLNRGIERQRKLLDRVNAALQYNFASPIGDEGKNSDD